MDFENFKVTEDLYASKGQRFANYLIDVIAYIAVIFGLFSLLTFVIYSVAEDTTVFDEFLYSLENVNGLVDRLVTGLVLALCYFLTESLTKGKTLGKFITKTKVVLEDGSKPSALHYIKRSLSRIIPFNAFSFLGSTGRGWHDSISKTYVVDEKRFNEKQTANNSLEEIGKPVIN